MRGASEPVAKNLRSAQKARIATVRKCPVVPGMFSSLILSTPTLAVSGRFGDSLQFTVVIKKLAASAASFGSDDTTAS
jgi:hypothetical protein